QNVNDCPYGRNFALATGKNSFVTLQLPPATLAYLAFMTPRTWGIIGPGKIANKFATALGMVEGARLGAIASRDAARGREFAARFGVATVYEDYASLAADPTIDAIYVAT